MSFKDLSTKIAAVVKPKPAETPKDTGKAEASGAPAKEPAPKSGKP
jgi:hypothetical protein